MSALGAIPKADGDVRVIHDGSRPSDTGLNDYAKVGSVTYKFVMDLLSVIKHGWYQCKTDLRWAYRYRVCGINRKHWTYTGFYMAFHGP